jgi:transposase
MNKEKTDEIGLRRKLFKFFDKEKSIKQILKLIPRSRSWLYKWHKRYQREGTMAATGRAKVPHRSPQAYAKPVVQMVLKLRTQLHNAEVGLVGAKAIRRELKTRRLVKQIPSLSTIHRMLKDHALIDSDSPVRKESYYPKPKMNADLCFHSMDWMLRYLQGGEKVFIFHTIDLQSRGLAQTLGHNKSVESVLVHAFEVWQDLGLPDFLQIDNDSAFTGLGKKGRIFGTFVRLCLFVGIELIFIPPAQAKRNAVVEGVNHLFAQSFWNKNEFKSFRDVERKRGKFLLWYQNYEPPSLCGLTIREANHKVKRRRLKSQEIESFPERLPLTKGRIHFIRKVSLSGEIEILKERWKVSRKLSNRYVWATVSTGKKSLQIYYKANERAEVKLIKEYDYEVGEKVFPLPVSMRRSKRAIGVQNLF